MGVVVVALHHLSPKALQAMAKATQTQRKEDIARMLVRRFLQNSRGPAVSIYRFDGPRATIYAARYGR